MAHVGLAGFEPAASAARTRRADQAALQPVSCRRREGNPDLRCRRPAPYPLDYVGVSPVGWSRTTCLVVISDALLPLKLRRDGSPGTARRQSRAWLGLRESKLSAV